MSIGAVIFDLDGVIADTAPYHLRAWQETLGKRGVEFTEEHFRHSFGQRNDAIISSVLGKGVSEPEMASIASEKEASFRRLARGRLRPLPGVIALIKSLAAAGFRLALASSTPRENIRLVTQSLGIGGYFQAIVGEGDVSEGKPSPQVFLVAAQRLGVEPRNCIVIEDALAGVTAAKKAGMRCIAVTTTHPKSSLGEADLVVDTLEAVTVAELSQLVTLSGQFEVGQNAARKEVS